ncbi:hypothetical protein ACFQAV_04285 [Companilactobacillus huachuanensis]|uniref:DUF1453 family protein n=1 Tax=Companilactobacillus huachuanensis TaxID=2559914 RepID=A0ABW1RJM2_9LACO|nr:hypothetical protein [Companilactobacillus huachuanensis]
MQNLSYTNIVLALLILYVVIKRQLEPRTVKFKPEFFIVVILFGIASIGDAVSKQHMNLSQNRIIIFGVLSLVSAAVFAILRAFTYKYWLDDKGLVMREGNWLTIVWWVIGIGMHMAVDRIWTGSSVTLLLYLGITLLIQRGIVWYRASTKYPSEISGNVAAQKKDSSSRQERRDERRRDRHERR